MVMQSAASRAISTGLAIYLVLLFATLFIASKSPHLGLAIAPGKIGVTIVSINSISPAANALKPGDEILAIYSNDKNIVLMPHDGIFEPGNTPSYKQYREFFKRQIQIFDIIQAEYIHVDILRNTEKIRVLISPAPVRGLKHFSALFWYQIACASFIMLMGIAAWAYTNREIGPRLYALAGSSMALAIMSSAIYTTRELALAPETFLLLARTNQVGITFFAAFGTAMMWYYPTRLGRLPVAVILTIIALTILGINFNHLVDNTNLSIRTPFVLWLMLNAALSYFQWRRTESDPIQRTRLKWLIYAWFVGLIGYISLVILPQLIGIASVIRQSYAWGFFVITYLGVLLGIIRYRLFDLERWVVHAWLWFFFGASFIALDLALVLRLNVEPSIGLFITLALMSWLYFPLRQWLIQRLTSPLKQPASNFLPRIIEHLFEQPATGSLKKSFQLALESSFQPLHICHVGICLTSSRLTDNGLKLQVPALDQSFSYELSHASQGRRLFDLKDASSADSVCQLFANAQRYRHALVEGIHAERERLAADLHDDIGSRVLSIVYTSKEPATQATARDTLQALRVAMQDLQHGEAHLIKVVDNWRREHHDRCQLAGLEFTISMDESLQAVAISASQRSQLTRIVRELVSNAINHAQANSAALSIYAEKTHLYLCYEDDGVGFSALSESDESHHMGLITMRQRIESLAGEMMLKPADSGTHWLFFFPFKDDEKDD
jgi:signal transduction histidine kinase